MATDWFALKSFKIDGLNKIAVYEGNQSSNGMILSFDVVLTNFRNAPTWEAAISFDGCEGSSPREVLKRLADWCGRAAQAIDQDEEWWNDTNLPLGKGCGG